MKKLSRASCAVALLLFPLMAFAQATGDYRSAVTTGTWATAANWESFNGTSWVTAGAAPSSTNGAINILNGNTISLAASGVSVDQLVIDSGGQLTINSTVTSTLVNGTGTDLTIKGTMLNSGGTWSISAGAWTVANGGTYIHNTTSGISTPLSNATLAAGSNFIYRGSSTLNAAIAVSNRTYSNLSFESSSGTWNTSALSGSGALTTNDLSVGANVNVNFGSYTGTTTYAGNISIAGTLGATNGARSFSVATDKSLTVASTGTVSMASGQTLTVSDEGATVSVLGGTISGAGNFVLPMGATLVTSNANGLDGAVTVSGTKSFSLAANYEFRGAGTGTALPSYVAFLTINRPSGNVTLDGSAASLSVDNDLKILSGNLAAGATTNTVIASSLIMRNGQINSDLTLGLRGPAIFDATNNGTATIAGNVTLEPEAHQFTINNGSAATDMEISGNVSGASAGVVKEGAGNLLLSGNNSYDGNTVVVAGTLTAGHNHALGTGAVSVNGGTLAINHDVSLSTAIYVGAAGTLSGTGTATLTGSLTGTGTLAGVLSLGTGANLNAGNSPGILNNTGVLTLDHDSTITWELAALSTTGAGTNFDQIANTGTINLSGGMLALSLGSFAPSADPFWTSNRSWTAIYSTGGGTVSGSAMTISTSQAGWASLGSFSTMLDGESMVVNWTAAAIPEPSTYAALCGALALAGVVLHRRRRALAKN